MARSRRLVAVESGEVGAANRSAQPASAAEGEAAVSADGSPSAARSRPERRLRALTDGQLAAFRRDGSDLAARLAGRADLLASGAGISIAEQYTRRRRSWMLSRCSGRHRGAQDVPLGRHDEVLLGALRYECNRESPPSWGNRSVECIEESGLTVTGAARRLGCSRPALSRVLNGRAAISAEMALALERQGWSNADFRIRRQAAYDLAQAPRKVTAAAKLRPSPARVVHVVAVTVIREPPMNTPLHYQRHLALELCQRERETSGSAGQPGPAAGHIAPYRRGRRQVGATRKYKLAWDTRLR